MNTDQALPLLGNLSPDQFMRRHWQRKPLLVRQAIPGFQPFLDRRELAALAEREDVESRLITSGTAKGWTFAKGPFPKSKLPAWKQAQWTLLVQGVDLHDERAHALLGRFRFVPDARLDDLMVSLASDGGGVGPLPPPGVLSPLPASSTFFAVSAEGAAGTGTGRLSACFASCSLLIAWYMSKPTKDRNL